MTESPSDLVFARAGAAEGGRFDAAPASNLLIAAIRYRWRTLLVISGASAAVSLAAVLLMIKPKYEVAAAVQVAQVVKPVLFSDAETDISRQYNVYLATQAQALASPSVISTALNAPEVRSLSMVTATPDPVTLISSRMVVEQVRGTEILKVSMMGKNPNELATIINNVLRTFIRLREDKQREWDEKILSSLRTEQAELAAKLEAKGIELRQLAVEQGSSEITDGGAPAGGNWTQELQRLLTQANKDAALAAARLEWLDKQEGISPGGLLDQNEFDEFRLRDPHWQQHSTQLAAAEPLSAGSESQISLGPQHPAVSARSQRVAALREALTAREADLRVLFRQVVRRRLENAKQDAEISVRILNAEWERLSRQREEAARQAVVLEDVRHERERLEQALSQVRQKIWNVQIEQNRMARITIDSPAVPPPTPNINQRPKYAAAALFASLCFGTFVALLRHRLDTSVRSPMEVTERLGLPLLGTLQHVPQANGALIGADTRLQEPIRAISTALLVSSENRPSHCRLITSPTPGSGKSTLAANLARSLAATGRRVLLVDADNYGQGVTRGMNMTNRRGMKELLDGTARTSEAVHAGDADHLDILPAGHRTDRFPEYLATQRSGATLRTLFEGYDEVVVDSPPVLAGSTAIILGTLVDEIVLVLRAGTTTQEHIQTARQCLAAVGEKRIGVVLNGVDPKRALYSYYPSGGVSNDPTLKT
jgi:capsular exopolysaccharide synthesis family protein